MAIYISEKLKQFRKARDLTQEQVAEIFNVSPQSVSRWETGATFPDMELLPHLAIFFKVTVDELIGTDEIRNEQQVGEYVREIRNLLNSGRLYEAIGLARKAAKEYPLNTGLHYHLVQALSKACSGDTPEAKENTEKFKAEIIAISERMINLTDYKSSLGHRYQLVQQYAKWGMKEEAKKLLDTMPAEIWDTQEPWAGLVLEGEEWRNNQRLRIIRATMLLSYFIGGYSNDDGLDALKKIECKKATLEIEHMANSICGYEIDTVHGAFQNAGIAELCCEADDAESALDYVEKAVRDAMKHVELMHKTGDDGSNYMAWSTPRNLPWILWEEHLSKPQFDIIRTHERFIKCFDELKANSRELKQ